MKRIFALLTCVLLVCALIAPAAAVESPTEVTATISTVTSDVVTSAKVAANSSYPGYTVVNVVDVTVPSGTQFPITLTFAVSGVTTSSQVVLIHYDGTQWVTVPTKLNSNGTITATFDSLSPVAFLVKGSSKALTTTTGTTGKVSQYYGTSTTASTTTAAGKSYQTGETVSFALPAMAILCLTGAAWCAFKVKRS